jgi:C1A family cysteine protease
MLDRLRPLSASNPELRDAESLIPFFPDIDDQLQINSCTAHACVDLVQYFDRRAFGRTVQLSKLFVYQSTQQLLGLLGNHRVDLRSTLKAIVTFGIPHKQYWPYDAEKLNDKPPAFLYALPNRYQAAQYLRLDGRNRTGRETLEIVKSFLDAGFPSVFGFSVPASISREGDIPYRPTFDNVEGGQAVIAIGYDDQRISSTKGALQIRNSWGREWGESGYGWLPYAYVEEQLAADFWTIVSPTWLDSDEFLQPRVLSRSLRDDD